MALPFTRGRGTAALGKQPNGEENEGGKKYRSLAQPRDCNGVRLVLGGCELTKYLLSVGDTAEAQARQTV